MITSFQTKRWPRVGQLARPRGRAALVRLIAVLVGAGAAVTLAAGPAGAQTTLAPPQPGVTLGVAGEGNERLDMFYTGTDRQVWMVHMSPMGENVPVSLGGQLIGGPAAVWVPGGPLSPTGGIAVFGRGTDNRLWWTHQTDSGWSRWASLGGNLTSKPAVAADEYDLLIYARGTDGAVWGRQEDNRAGLWIGWHKIGGRLLPGTAPAAAYSDNGIFIAAVGTDHAVWVGEDLVGSAGIRWHSIGGRTNSNPGLATPSEGVVVAFLRGTGNVAWYREFFGQTPGVTAGWHSLGGSLTSGVTAITQQEDLQFGPTGVFALGPDSRAWMDSGTWPALTGWQQVRIGS